MTTVCKCPVNFLNDSELMRSDLFYTAMFLGVWRAITKVSTDLGIVKTNKGENVAEVAVLTINMASSPAYEDTIHELSTKPPKGEKRWMDDCPEGVLSQHPDKVHNNSPSFLLLLIILFVLCRVLCMDSAYCKYLP